MSPLGSFEGPAIDSDGSLARIILDETDPEATEEERGIDPEREPREAERQWNDGGIADATLSRSFF